MFYVEKMLNRFLQVGEWMEGRWKEETRIDPDIFICEHLELDTYAICCLCIFCIGNVAKKIPTVVRKLWFRLQ